MGWNKRRVQQAKVLLGGGSTVYKVTLKATGGSVAFLRNTLQVILLAVSATIAKMKKVASLIITTNSSTITNMRKIPLLTFRAVSQTTSNLRKLLSLKIVTAASTIATLSKVYLITLLAVSATLSTLATKLIQAVIKLVTLTARSTSSGRIGKFLYFSMLATSTTTGLISIGKRYLLTLLGSVSTAGFNNLVQVYATYESLYINKITIGNVLVTNIAQNQGQIPFPSSFSFRGNIAYVDVRYLENKTIFTSPPIAANLYIGNTLIPLSYMSSVVGMFTGSFYNNIDGPQDVYVEFFMLSPIKGWYASQPFRLYLTEEL